MTSTTAPAPAPASPGLPAALQVSQMIVSLWVPQAVHAAAELGIADRLAGKPLTAAALASQLGTHPDSTERLLCALVTLRLLSREGDTFAPTELGHFLQTGVPYSRRAWSRLMGSPATWQAWGRLTDCVRTGRRASALDGPETDPFDAIAADPAATTVFHQAMADLTSGVAPGIVSAVDWTGVRRVVDVGGGWGTLLCAILEANPELEGAVFDLEPARAGAQEQLASRGLSSRARFVAGSFFETPPPPAEVYIVKSCIHDWDDENSVRILGRCREAMDERARLLLVEPPVGAAGGNPLTDWFLSFSDLNMLVNVGGRERTEAEYRALLVRAGLVVTAVLETTSFFRVFESRRR
jgi:hypothetical protein